MRIDGPIAIFGDLRFAVRSLSRTPGFVLIAIVTLGLGIGANTSAFSLINEVFLRPLPYPDSGQLDRIYRAIPQNSRGGVAPADYLDLKPQLTGYGEIAAYAFADMNLSEPGQPAEMARGLRISADLFSVLGVQPELGRSFRPEETVLGNHRVLMISHRYWQNRFGGDDHIVGRTVRVDGAMHEIVGVLPDSLKDWRHLGPFDVFRPLGLTETETTDRGATFLRLVGRRSRTLTRAQADGFIGNFGRRLAAEFPAVHAASTWRTLSLEVAVAPDNGPGIFAMLIGLSGLVLLIACSNLANFETVGTRVLDGRTFGEGDTLTSPKVFIINRAMARGLFGGESPLGRRIAQAGGKTIEWGEIVGVASDVQSIYPDRVPVPYQLYQPIGQEPRLSSEIAVLTTGTAPSTLVDSIRTTMAALDANLPVRELQPAQTAIARANYSWQILGSMLSFLAALGLGLASLGMYGVVARTTAQRTGEFGIRIALGALAGDIIRLVLASGAKLALVGSAIGLLGAFGIARLIAAFFPGMQTSNVPVLTGVTLLLMAIALIACYVPARHASRISPIETLRAE